MRLNPEYELMQIADDYVAVPLGSQADSFSGVVALSEPAYFLVSQMKEEKSKEMLVRIITDIYDVDAAKAETDIDDILGTLLEAGVILSE